MRVFVTGATGFVGSAVVKELLGAGHQVLGLARSEASAQALIAVGAEVLYGNLEELESLKKGATSTDGTIHCGFIHDFANFAASVEVDKKAIETIGAALEGSGKPFINTSGTAGLSGLGRPGTEDDVAGPAFPRSLAEEMTLALAEKGVRAMVLRLPPSVHGDGDHGFVPVLIGVAREKGVAAYIGDGQNHWPAVHRLDAARLYRLALEKGTAGSRYHAIGDQGVTAKRIAEAIGHRLNVPVGSVLKEEAPAHFGWIGHFFSLDVPATSVKTFEQLGWTATGVGLIEDLEKGTYF